eukprot:GDKK01010666.1.p1 GENE.GDKK01010666.1~~GDKK01010666.1.p1  ORF type:complete len:282 (+),score=0.23 GDKK01010666.1:1-846(+)
MGLRDWMLHEELPLPLPPPLTPPYSPPSSNQSSPSSHSPSSGQSTSLIESPFLSQSVHSGASPCSSQSSPSSPSSTSSSPSSSQYRSCESLFPGEFPSLPSPSVALSPLEAPSSPSSLNFESLSLFQPLAPKRERKKALEEHEKETRVLRQGQSKFREGVLIRCNNRCVITGVKMLCVLEAAHILPYKDRDMHADIDIMNVANGIALRADLHILFDNHCIWVIKDSDGLLHWQCNDAAAEYLPTLRNKLCGDAFSAESMPLLEKSEHFKNNSCQTAPGMYP